MRQYKKFTFGYIMLLLAAIVMLLPLYIFLLKSFEHSTYDEIVAKQLESNAIYGTATSQNTFSYKLELVKAVKPDVVAWGSSRVMQMRREFFSVPFVTIGGAVNHLSEGMQFLEKMVTFHKPKQLILSLDFWWFNGDYIDPMNFGYHQNDGKQLTFKKLKRPLQLLKDKKLSPETFVNIFTDNRLNKSTNFPGLGLHAISTSNGYRVDGSYFYALHVFGDKPKKGRHFKQTMHKIEKGLERFKYAEHIDPSRLRYLKKILDFCQKHDIEPIVMIPPVSPTIAQKLGSMPDQFAHIQELRSAIKSLGVEAHDYHDPENIASDDCEFYDGFHGGDVTYQRILLDMAERESALAPVIATDLLPSSIERNRGRALSVFHPEMYVSNKENDFLDLGCQKSPLF